MNVKTTIVLLILLILCAGYMLVFHAGRLGRNGKPDASKGDKRLTGQVGEVQRLVLEKPGTERIIFARRDGKWRITEPIDAPADDRSVDAVVTNIANLRHVRKYAENDPECPKDDLTHLSAPQQTVTFTDDKGATFTIRIGLKAPPPPGGRTYLQLAGDKHVYVVEADLQTVLTKTLADYRLKHVARFDSVQAERITVRGDENYQLVKADDKWVLDSPVRAGANQKKVNALLNAASDIEAEKFIDDNPENLAPFGLDNPRLVVTVELSSQTPMLSTQSATQPKGKVISIAFGTGTDKKVFAKLADKPWVFQAAESGLADLQPKLSDLRDKSILDAAGREITKVEISLSAGGSATLEKDKGQWRMLSPFKGDCENNAVHNLLKTLQGLKADDFRDNPATLAAFGLEPPQGKITLHFSDSDKTQTLLLGRISDSGQMAFVMAGSSKSVAIITSADLAKLTKPSPAYWNRTIFDIPEDATITSVELHRPDGTFTIAKSDEGEFKLTKPVKAKTDAKNVDALLKAASNIRADKIVVLNETLPKRFAQAKGVRVKIIYRIPVPATQPATTSQPTTQLARPDIIYPVTFVVIKDKGKSYVWMTGDAGPIIVGELPGSFYDKFAAEMRDRTVLKIEAKEIVSLKMTLGEKSMEFVRAEKVWRFQADRFVKIDASKIEQFITSLSGIKVKRFADYSDKPKLHRFKLDKPAMTLTLKTDKGKEITLKIAGTGPVGTRGLYAVSSESPGVFVLAPETSAKISKSLKDFQEKNGK